MLKNTLFIEGGYPLHGQVRISGAKNAGLVLIVASIMADGETILDNVPRIRDVEVLLQILEDLGVRVSWNEDGSLSICPPANLKTRTSYELSKKLRASNLLLGALLGSQGEAQISMPGGCDIGSRPMDLHIKGVQALGAEVDLEYGYINAKAPKRSGGRVYLDFPSVGATENIMMMAVKTPGQTVIENAAKEPEIVDLANFLNSMGADIRGAGTNVIKIRGVPQLKGGTYSIIPDQIEAGTYMAAAAAAGGEVLIRNVIPKHLDCISNKLREMGVEVEDYADSVLVRRTGPLKRATVKTMPYPGFPTDMQPQITTVLCLADGTSVVTEGVWENRFKYVDELLRMGGSIRVTGQTAIVEGVGRLTGACVKATDLRAGAALVIAGLAAAGRTEVEGVHYIERGYENFVGKLKALGADIESVVVPEEDAVAAGREAV